VTESIYDPFYKDFMSRQVCAYFHLSRGRYLFRRGERTLALKHLDSASRIGYDDTTIHSDISVLLVKREIFDRAREELEKALVYYEDLSGVYNNWGFYFDKKGDYEKAAIWYGEAIGLKPEDHGYYNNLGLTLYNSGKVGEAVEAFRKSLNIEPDQGELKRFIKEKGLPLDNPT
jgi:tetratricopeptide (TPR) repeat protein